jgi:hypothetical protein
MKLLNVLLLIVLAYLLYKNTEHFWFESRTKLVDNSMDYTAEVKRTELSKSSDLLPAGSECESDSNCTPGLKCKELIKVWNAASPLQENAESVPFASPTSKGSMKVCRFDSSEYCSDFGRPSTNCF